MNWKAHSFRTLKVALYTTILIGVFVLLRVLIAPKVGTWLEIASRSLSGLLIGFLGFFVFFFIYLLFHPMESKEDR